MGERQSNMAIWRVRFVNSSDIVGTLIDIVSDSDVDHVEFDSGTGWQGARDVGGVQNRPYDYMKPTREFVFGVEVPDANYKIGIAWADNKIGTKYNFGAVVSDLLHDPSINQSGHLLCSQYIYGVARAMGLIPLNRQVIKPHNVTPGGLMLSPIFDNKLVPYANGTK